MRRFDSTSESILVIKLGALGDFFFALGAMEAIRAYHTTSRISLLTTAPYVELAQKTGFFNEIYVDERPPLWHISKVRQLYLWAKKHPFDRVYDLQNVARTRLYMRWLFSSKVWNGEQKEAAFSFCPPQEILVSLHQTERKRQQLEKAGIDHTPQPDLSFLKSDITQYTLPMPYFLLVPGSSVQGRYKRWPARFYGEIAQKLVASGLTPVIIGGKDDRDDIQTIMDACPQARSLCDQTSLDDLATLARSAKGVLGNDTGPFHILWLAGCPAVGLFSGETPLYSFAPVGKEHTWIQEPAMESITVERVWDVVEKRVRA